MSDPASPQEPSTHPETTGPWAADPAEARQAVGDFLLEKLIKPQPTRPLSEEQLRKGVRGGAFTKPEIGTIMRSMSLNERIAVEMEMQQRTGELYTSTYDPLAF